MAAEESSSTIWVPVCCERVMRHNCFRSGETAVAASFVCTSCGKNVNLTPSRTEVLADFGAGAQLIPVVAVARPAQRKVGSKTDADPDAETLM